MEGMIGIGDVRALAWGIVREAVGLRVRVHVHLDQVTEYGNQLAIIGTLDGSPDGDRFRVLTGEESDRAVSYAYFGLDSVTAVADRRVTSKGTFDCGAVLVIYVGGSSCHPFGETEVPTVIASVGSTPAVVVLR